MARLLITVLFAVVFVGVLRIQAKNTNLSSQKFLKKRRTTGEAGQLRAKRTASAGLDQAEKDQFLKTHNDDRGNTDPTASNMKQMVWNDLLATMAQEWSDGCHFAHGQPDDGEPPYSVGQNIYVTTADARPTGEQVVSSWHGEGVDFKFSSNSCAAGKVCGHYTQVVWADSYDLGCGMKLCAEIPEINYKNAWLVTCNYGPAGNYQGEKPFQEGTPCSACPDHQCENNECAA